MNELATDQIKLLVDLATSRGTISKGSVIPWERVDAARLVRAHFADYVRSDGDGDDEGDVDSDTPSAPRKRGRPRKGTAPIVQTVNA